MSDLRADDYRELDRIITYWRVAQDKYKRFWKGKFTNFVTSLAANYGSVTARQSLLTYVQLLKLEDPKDRVLGTIAKRLSCRLGHFYFEGRLGYGWVNEGQVQAIRLPLTFYDGVVTVSYQFLRKQKNLFEAMGFFEPLQLPLQRHIDSWVVVANVEEAGYLESDLIPCSTVMEPNALVVTRNLKKAGFWKAYAIWDGCHDWYRERGLYLESDRDGDLETLEEAFRSELKPSWWDKVMSIEED